MKKLSLEQYKQLLEFCKEGTNAKCIQKQIEEHYQVACNQSVYWTATFISLGVDRYHLTISKVGQITTLPRLNPESVRIEDSIYDLL